MWNRPRFDLKVRLTLRVAAITAACFAAISAYFLIAADRAVHARIDGIAAIVAKSLELQQGKIQWAAGPRDFPNLDPVAAYVMTPGLCLAFRGASGEMLQRF
ncbi:histidine kinase, partial [Bradyrhizobium sp. SHOUNA76]|nr:histidine kinase [Bradyrhizobium sp. SHOUNA76]